MDTREYFGEEDAARYMYGEDTEGVLNLISGKYIGDNPPVPLTWRAHYDHGFPVTQKAETIFNFSEQFPDTRPGDVAYALCESLWHSDRNVSFTVSCQSPMRIWANGEAVFASHGGLEANPDAKAQCTLPLRAGWNRFLIRFECTAIGFGGTLAASSARWDVFHPCIPLPSQRGASGFAYTHPMPLAEADALESALLMDDMERVENATAWLPTAEWQRHGVLDCFSGQDGYVYAWTCISLSQPVPLSINEGVRVWVDGMPYSGEELVAGRHGLVVQVEAQGDGCQFIKPQTEAHMECPLPVKGGSTPWLYAGIFAEALDNPWSLTQGIKPFISKGGATFWRLQTPGFAVRPFLESLNYGRWTYPLGVTLYGLLKTGEALGRRDYISYAMGHASFAVDADTYAQYDKARYGFPGVNEQLTWLDALDDCGSFGSLMLECERVQHNPNADIIADRIADFIMNKLERMPDGAFQRHNTTMWADDMYMSVPFLIRNWKRTGDIACLDEAAKQMLLYKQYLFIPETNVMSHMFSIRHLQANGIPWSRGNGWVYYSLSQLLGELSDDHPKRESLLIFFRQMTVGFLALQDETGLWHQVLDDSESYLESSATAMFVCGFARGIHGGWLDTKLETQAKAAVQKGWIGLTQHAIDKHGNIYGVCQGSGFSFSRTYYRQLGWRFNDTHGIGIILLAGVEAMRLS